VSVPLVIRDRLKELGLEPQDLARVTRVLEVLRFSVGDSTLDRQSRLMNPAHLMRRVDEALSALRRLRNRLVLLHAEALDR
jgi:hypothetical protein